MFITILLLVPHIECSDVELISADGRFTGTILTSTTGLALKTSEEKRAFPLDELVELSFGKKPVEDYYVRGIRFHNGDRLSGAIKKLENEKLVVESDLFGLVKVPLTHLAGLDFRSDRISHAKTSRKTHVRLANGDALPGSLRWLDHTSIGVKSSLGLVNIERARAFGITFTNTMSTKSMGLQAVVRFCSGDRVTGKWEGFKAGQLYLTLPSIGEVHFPVEAITAVLFTGGKSTFMSDMKIKSHESETFVPGGVPRRFRKDASWSGSPIMLNGRRYEKGVSQHARSRLTFSLVGYQKFHAVVGLDDEVKALSESGDAICQIFVDGRKKFERRARQAGKAIEVQVDVAGAKQISLVADFGEGGDAGDRVTWAMARVTR